jgi:hypothetical protein
LPVASFEIGNGKVAGVLCSGQGTLSVGAVVQLFPTEMIPYKTANSVIYVDTTDFQGRYEISKVDTGMYNIEAIDNSGQNRLLRRGVAITRGENGLGNR